MMKKLMILVVMILNLDYCFAATDGFMVGNDSRVRVFNYKDDEIYNIYLSEGKALVIEFESGEEVMQKGIGIGSSGAIDVGKNNNILMVKPRSINYNTNLIVVTNKRNYVFNVLKPTNKNIALYKVIFNYDKRSSKVYNDNNVKSKSSNVKSNKKSKKQSSFDNTYSHIQGSTVFNKNSSSSNNDSKSIKNNKSSVKIADNPQPPKITITKQPAKQPVAATSAVSTTAVSNAGAQLKQPSLYDYIVKGDRQLIPIAVFDNGHLLYMVFKSKKDIPLIYKLDRRNRERLIRPTIKNTTISINEIPAVVILKKGKKSLQIKRMNKM